VSSWHSLEEYVHYVSTNAVGSDRFELLHPSGAVFDESYKNILLSYDSMPKWLDSLNPVGLDNSRSAFSYYERAYRLDKKDYIDKVKGRLRQIKGRLTGLALLAEIRSTHYTLRIKPFHGTKLLADEEPDDDVDATARGKPVDYYKRKSSDVMRLGRGVGSDANIGFSPDVFKGSAMAQPGHAPDEVLFHEMVHASRDMRGKSDRKPANAGYGDQEEYLAIVLTNLFLSEKGQLIFRASHDEWDGYWVGDKNKQCPKMPAKDTLPEIGANYSIIKWGDPDKDCPQKRANSILEGPDADNFLKGVQNVDLPPTKLIEAFRWSQPSFFFALAHLPPDKPKYNWVKQYYDQQKENFTM
jgi:Effector protein